MSSNYAWGGPRSSRILARSPSSTSLLVTIASIVISLIVIIQLTSTIGKVEAKTETLYWDGDWYDVGGWIYLAKFCFDDQGQGAPGKLTWQVVNGSDVSGVYAVIYDDESASWPAVLKNNWSTCEQLVTMPPAKDTVSLHQYPTYEIHIDEVERPRFWYVALAACNRSMYPSEYNGPLELFLQFENPGGFFKRQFSKDKQGILEMTIVFMLITLIMGIIYGAKLVGMIKAKELTMIGRLFALALYAQLVGLILQFCHYIKYAVDGEDGFLATESLATLFNIASELCFILLLLFIASGGYAVSGSLANQWTRTNQSLNRRASLLWRSVIIGIFAVLVLLYAFLFLWAELAVDSSASLYIFDTAAGVLIALFRIPLMLFFLARCITTALHETSYDSVVGLARRIFYFVFGAAYSLWLLVLPFAVLVAFVLPAWVRWKTIQALTHTTYTLALMGMLVLLSPLWPMFAKRIGIAATTTAAASSESETATESTRISFTGQSNRGVVSSPQEYSSLIDRQTPYDEL